MLYTLLYPVHWTEDFLDATSQLDLRLPGYCYWKTKQFKRENIQFNFRVWFHFSMFLFSSCFPELEDTKVDCLSFRFFEIMLCTTVFSMFSKLNLHTSRLRSRITFTQLSVPLRSRLPNSWLGRIQGQHPMFHWTSACRRTHVDLCRRKKCREMPWERNCHDWHVGVEFQLSNRADRGM